MGTLHPVHELIMGFSRNRTSHLLYEGWGVQWATADFILAHKAVKESGKHNFEGCRIPIPTTIRYDRIEEALEGVVSPKEKRVLDFFKYGMPLYCKPNFGVYKKQNNL